MSIEPLHRDVAINREVARRATAAVAARRPAARPSSGMCLVVPELADGDAPRLVRDLRRRGDLRVVLLARRAGRAELVGLLAGGLRGAVSARTEDRLPRTVQPEPPEKDGSELTARELGVLERVAEGRSNRMIGEDLGLSALTVKSHLARISRKLGTGDRAALVAIAYRTGLLR